MPGARVLLAAVLTAAVLTACSGPDATGPDDDRTSSGAPSPSGRPSGSAAGPSSTAGPSRSAAAPRVPVDAARTTTAVAAVRHLAGRIGARPGTSPAYFRAADWVEGRLTELGWTVERQSFRAPGGVSWGEPVAAGRSVNLVARLGEVRPDRGWLAVGAHLDTVPQAPGAEDNASGVGVLLAVAEALAGHRTRLPVVLVAYGAEEPRGPTDDDHHYGSRAFVASLDAARRKSLRGMISLDRVGVGAAVVIGSPTSPDPLRAEVVAAARRAHVPHRVEDGQRSSDHWSFVRAGLAGVRLGSTPYAGYHSPGDVPSVVDPAQLGRTARLVLAWLR
ncbi:M28 family metallopeptidase [Nocardioides sambongensis]|uniref:M28 family metallopeptidase n=1 Tax=Nocardioides sambongensis TaxID=2589074 RepID=UPI0018C89706|nr:M28 family peptidase [Nocardioides sambongensis]